MRLNDGLDSSRQLTSSFLSLLSMLKRNSEHFLRKQSACLCETLHPENAFHGQRTADMSGWMKPFVKVVWGRIVDFLLSPPLSQVLLFLPISCVSSIWTARGRLRAVRACYESPSQRRDAGMLGWGGIGGWFGSSVFACQNVLCALSQGPKCLTHHGCDQKGQLRSQYYHSCRKHVRRYLRVWKRSCSFCLWCFDAGMDPWAGPQPSLVYLGQAQSRKGWRIWPLTKGDSGISGWILNMPTWYKENRDEWRRWFWLIVY